MKRCFVGVGVALLLIGVAGCSKKSQPSSEAQTNPANGGSRPSSQTVAASAEETPPAAHNEGTGVFINGRELNPQQVMALAATYRYAPPRGYFWYDAMSGAWGVEGHETIGFILPGYDLGPLAADASAGNTGVFINGREINMVEAAALQRTFGAVYQGHWWIDGRTGNFGLEGNPMPIGNILAALRAQGRGGRAGGDNFWASSTAMGNSSGGCSYVNVGGGQTATSGCD
jgi:hypothetical protein